MPNQMSENNVTNNVIESFSYCFSNFDCEGVEKLLTPNFDHSKYDRKKYLEFLKSYFETLKQNGAEKFKVLKTKCTGCQCEKEGYCL